MNLLKTFSIYSILLLFLSHCGPSGNEVLATFEGGSVTRSEMRYLLTMELGEEANNKATIQMQSSKLRQIALIKLGALAFDKSKKHITEKEKKMTKLRELEAQQLTYTYKLKKESNDFQITMHEFQFLILNQNPDGPMRNEEGNSYLKELNSGDLDSNEIEDFIQKKSEHGRYRWIGGYMDPVCSECNLNAGLRALSIKEMLKAAQNKKENEFVLLSQPSNIIIFRKLKSEKLTLQDLESYLMVYFRKTMKLASYYEKHAPKEQKASAAAASMVKNEKQLETSIHKLAQRQKFEINKKITSVRMEQLRNKYKFEWLLKNPQILLDIDSPKTNLSTSIFKIQDKDYTLENLKKDLVYLGLDQEGNKNLFSIVNGIIIPKTILEYDSDFNKSKNSDEFKFFTNIINLRIKNQAYFGNLPIEEPSEQKIREFYKSHVKKSSGKIQSLAKLRKKITDYLKNQKRTVLIKEQQKVLSTKYKLKILSKLLIANEL